MSDDTRKIADKVTAASSSPGAEMAALPIVDAPTISPAAGETVPVETAAAEIVPVETDAAPAAPAPTATQRFRATAATQIAAARERMAQRKLSVSAVALIAGFSGALSSAGMAHLTAPADQNVALSRSLADNVSRLATELAALRSEVEQTTKLAEAQAGQTSERFERVEKAQAEPSAKIINLAEVVEKLRAASASVAAAAAPKGAAAGDITGSIAPPASKAAAKLRSTPFIVDGWALRELDRDIALIEGKRGLLEILVGDDIPGVGRVESFRKKDGHWVVVTSKGLIVPR